METTAPQLIKLSELADILNVSERHIYRWIKNNKIPYFQSPWKNAAYMFDLEAVKTALPKKYSNLS